jgi:hypothetical protein
MSVQLRRNPQVVLQEYFVYAQSLFVPSNAEHGASKIAAAIGDPRRASMLYCLMDGHARTATELAIVADVSASTASVHLNRLKASGSSK